ncbi:MAG: 30S ribosomal protein S6 [Parcubacteria group bacterium ADurb.Bin326]|nr:MAG: 30S ribosomal protein S6 [Parcubacteria group bacterium ADurb.Bin326]
MKNYELLYIIPNQYTEDEAKGIKEKIDGVIKSHGGVIGYENLMGKRKLAYPIDKIAHGYYILTEFELEDGTKLKEINDFLRLDKEILRAQVIAKKKITPEEIERQKKQEAEFKEIETKDDRSERPARAPRKEERPVAKEKVEKKVEAKPLDEKLNEILSGDDII